MQDDFLSEKPTTILIVDDDPITRLEVRRILEKEHYVIAEAVDGLEALEAAAQLVPDLILLDATLPRLDGISCCAHIAQLPQLRHTQILMITGLSDPVSVDRAFAAGATDYVTKPIHWAVLRQRVRRIIQQTQLQIRLEQANNELTLLAMLDPLTHIANRRHFDEVIAREWARMSRDRQWLSLVLCDVDQFKLYNDQYGHTAGDHCLRQVAKAAFDSLLRAGDLAARYGGEEFAIVLPSTELVGAIHVAERMRQNVRHLALPHAATEAGIVTLSLGVACTVPERGGDPIALINAADRALYTAKRAGRDRVASDGELLVGSEEPMPQ